MTLYSMLLTAFPHLLHKHSRVLLRVALLVGAALALSGIIAPEAIAGMTGQT